MRWPTCCRAQVARRARPELLVGLHGAVMAILGRGCRPDLILRSDVRAAAGQGLAIIARGGLQGVAARPAACRAFAVARAGMAPARSSVSARSRDVRLGTVAGYVLEPLAATICCQLSGESRGLSVGSSRSASYGFSIHLSPTTHEVAVVRQAIHE